MTVAISPRIPTGDVHEVPVEDLFFSTTDAKGIIDEGNEVFTRNSRFSREQLLGAPHNLIRHPDMPAAVFHVMWAMLAAGQPVCAYVKNLAADGSIYRAFATVVPIGDRYLSVRSRPRNIPARDLVEGLYASVREVELAARAAGASARDAAIEGAEVLGKALQDNGFESYAALQLDLVPVEVAAREAECPPLPRLDDAPDVVRSMLHSVEQARGLLGGFAAGLDDSLGTADRLGRDVRRLGSALASLGTAVEAAQSDTAAAAAAELGALAPLLTSQLGDVGQHAEAAVTALEAPLRCRKQLRLSASIARLQAEAIGRYVVAVARGTEDPRVSERALSSLTAALLAILDADLAADHTATQEYAARIDGLSAAVATVRDLAGSWLELLHGHAGTELAQALETTRELRIALDGVTGQVQRVHDGLSAFASTADLDREALAAALTDVTSLAARI